MEHCRTRSMTLSRSRSSAPRSWKATVQFANCFSAASTEGRTALILPLFTVGTCGPMRCMKACLVRFRRPTPKSRRSRPNITRSSCFCAQARISSTEPLPPPISGSSFASGPTSTQFQTPPSASDCRAPRPVVSDSAPLHCQNVPARPSALLAAAPGFGFLRTGEQLEEFSFLLLSLPSCSVPSSILLRSLSSAARRSLANWL
mmetsp:Transcript_55714/g.180893  ORF Transcript_55714/g.180893 Transcript_55714/m.180893 type:complete len:203 (+) Transcript_55714:1278-1886(+)